MSDWNAQQYTRFAAQRTQPALDLISRLSGPAPRRILDIGCGPGNSTAALHARWPEADILGIDTSDAMLEKARSACPDLHFLKCRAPEELGKLEKPFGLIFSNACIHWIPEQQQLIRSVYDLLAPGGVFAVQLPMVQKAPFYQMLDTVLADPAWQDLRSIRNFHNLTPEGYYDVLSALSPDLQLWETVYYHTVNSREDVLAWYSGSGLRPYLSALDDAHRARFTDCLRAGLEALYPLQADSRILLKMPRLFFTIRRP